MAHKALVAATTDVSEMFSSNISASAGTAASAVAPKMTKPSAPALFRSKAEPCEILTEILKM
jgi:hypothetical protein